MIKSITDSHMPQTLFKLFLMTCLGALSLAAQGYRAGVAIRDVTPSPLLPVSGGIGPSNPVTETRGKLSVRALAIELGKTSVVFVSSDFLGFPSVLGDRVRAMVGWIPGDHVLIGATHTHSAPDCYGFPDGQGGHGGDPAYWDWVCAQMAAAIRSALTSLQPASLRIQTGEARGKIAYNYYAPELYDPRCSVIQATDSQGAVIATLVNYAVHPEVLGANVGLCSPDLIWPLTERIEQKAGGVALFINGAQGGMVTADNRQPEGGDSRTWEECERIGELLADESLRILEQADEDEPLHLRVHSRRVHFPVQSKEMLAVLEASPLGFDVDSKGRIATTLNLVELGSAQILTIPGEALPNLGYYLKRQMSGQHNLLMGLTNDAFGYIMSRVDWSSFKRYEYITRVSLGEQTGEILIAEAQRLLDRVD